jgi:signal transduction histidine kinase
VFTNTILAQDLVVYASKIDENIEGFALDNQDYHLIESGEINHPNGQWTAVKLVISEEKASKENFIHIPYSLLDVVEVWIKGNENQLRQLYKTGQSFIYDTRPYSSSDFVFPVLEDVKEYYFKIYSSKPVILPFQIESSESLNKHLTVKDLLFGLFTGAILMMFLYNLVLFFLIRERTYLYYVIYLITLLLAQLSLFGYSDRLLTYNLPYLNQKITVLSAAIVGLTTIFFIVNFLKLKQKAPLYYKLIFVVIFFEAFVVLFLLMGWDILAYHWANFASFYGSIIVLIVAAKLTLSGYKPAKLFLIAWSVFLVSVIVFALMNMGILPYRPYFHASMIFGSTLEMFLLSVALADRYNVLRKEKLDSQQKLIQIARENEKIIQKQKIVLEQEVQLRTRELQRSNKELKATLYNLKETQSQLIQSEKMASLGILTAGVAHELNNPLNYIHGGITAMEDELKNENTNLNIENLKDYLTWIKSGEERAKNIVKSINIYNRTNENYIETISINDIIEDCLLIMQCQIREKLSVVKQLNKDLKLVKGNKAKLHQAIVNLLTNAIDSIKDDNGVIKITTSNQEQSVIVSIEDDGIGISKSNLKKVLDPFYTTKAPGKGTGLGLSIVHSIVKKHNGSITIDSELEKGTKVTLSIPVE